MQKRVVKLAEETVESLKIAGEGQLPPSPQVPSFQMDRASISRSKSHKTKSESTYEWFPKLNLSRV